MEDYLFEKYCIEGFDEELDKIFKKYLDLCKDTTIIINDGWIDCKKSIPTKDMDKKPVWIVYGSPMNLSVQFAYCEWTCQKTNTEMMIATLSFIYLKPHAYIIHL